MSEARYHIMVLDTVTPHLHSEAERNYKEFVNRDRYIEDRDEAERYLLAMGFRGWYCLLWDCQYDKLERSVRPLIRKELPAHEDS